MASVRRFCIVVPPEIFGSHHFSRPASAPTPSLSQAIVAPKKFLQDMTGKQVAVKLKWGMEYKGAWTNRCQGLARNFARAKALSRFFVPLSLTRTPWSPPPRPSRAQVC
jgi:hypothetical protein